MKRLVEAFKAVELARLDNKSKPTIYNNNKKYIPIKISSKRSQKGYTIRYVRKTDLDMFLSPKDEK